jgi:hypothetical protein
VKPAEYLQKNEEYNIPAGLQGFLPVLLAGFANLLFSTARGNIILCPAIKKEGTIVVDMV